MQQDLNSLISTGTQNGEHHAPFVQSTTGEYGSLKPRRTKKNLFSAQRNVSWKTCKNVLPES